MTESLTEFLLVKISFVFLTLLKCNFCKAQSLPKSFSCFTSKPFHQQLCVLCLQELFVFQVFCFMSMWLLIVRQSTCAHLLLIHNYLPAEPVQKPLAQRIARIILHSELQALNWNVNHCNPMATWSPPFANDDEGVLQKLAITSDINGNGGFWIATHTYTSEI